MAASLRSRTTVRQPTKDAVEDNKTGFRAVLTSGKPGWDVISPEDTFVNKKLKRRIQNEIQKTVAAVLDDTEASQDEEDAKGDGYKLQKSRGFSQQREFNPLNAGSDCGTCSRLSNLPLETQQIEVRRPLGNHSSHLDLHFNLHLHDEDDQSDGEHNEWTTSAPDAQFVAKSTTGLLPRDPDERPLTDNPVKPKNRFRGYVQNMLFPLDTFRLLQERGWLPEVYKSFRLKYELEHNHLIVHMASPAHDAAANSWNDTITLWHSNGGGGEKTLRQRGQGCITRLRYMLKFCSVHLDGWLGEIT